MSLLALSCFGAFQAVLDGVRLTNFHSIKAQALLAYLALEADRPHHRESLAMLLWPLDAEGSARNSLRQALYDLRRLLGDSASTRDAVPYLLVTRQTVQFNAASNHMLDAADFLQHIESGALGQAAILYRGDLLTGLSCESELFEEWLRLSRERFHNLAIDLYAQLAQSSLTQGNYAQAKQYARRQLALEPWREEAHRQLMTALLFAGERSAALTQYEICRRVLAEELGVEPDTETTTLYNQIRLGQLRPPPAGSADTLAPTTVTPALTVVETPPPSRPHNLPPQSTPFVGRKAALAQINDRLADPACRLLTLIGPGGMGKTRLAIQVAQELATQAPQEIVDGVAHQTPFADGIFFVALAPVASPDSLVSTIADAMSLAFYGNSELRTQLLDYLRPKSILLLLDNFEHLLSGVHLVSDLLAMAPRLKVLTTSREPLNLYEEWLFPLGGMRLPEPDIDEDLVQVESYSAVQLFVRCAQRVYPAFDLATERDSVVRICQLVEGMPLGIELAAAWRKVFTSQQIAHEVARNLDFLATSLRNVPARHRSMRAVFEHSWNLISLEEQQMLLRLAVFRGGFHVEAAEAIASASFQSLSALAEKWLLQRMPNGRYQMHELLRQYAEEKLQANPAEDERVQNEHCRFYTLFLERQEARLQGSEHFAAIEEIETEIENVRVAWARAVAQDDVEALERGLESLCHFYDTKSWYEQGTTLFRSAATALSVSQGDRRQQILLAHILSKQAQMQEFWAGDGGRRELVDPTQQLLQQVLAILQPYGESIALGDALWSLSNLYYAVAGKHHLGHQLRHQALAIYEQFGDRWRIARAMVGMGYEANVRGQYQEAMRYYERGFLLCEQIGDVRIKGDILSLLAGVHRVLGDFAKATQLAQASLSMRTAAGHQRGIAFSLYVLGDLAWRAGNHAEALRYSLQSRDLFIQINLHDGLGFALNNLGNIACTSGDYVEARRHFQKILQSSLDLNNLENQTVPWALAGLAQVAYHQAHPHLAIVLIEHVFRHPRAWQEVKDQAAKLLSTLRTEVPTQVITAAQAQAKAQELAAAVAELLDFSWQPPINEI